MSKPELPLPLQFLAAWIGLWVGRHQERVIAYQREELRLLRENRGARRLRFTDVERMRLARLGKEVGRKALREVATLASPETILRWYRELVAKKYDGSSKRAPGRPRVSGDITDLVLRMAADNPRWGYTRIRGALANVGHEVGRTTIKRILLRQGVEPAPERKRQYPWATFIRVHLNALAAMDFFTVEVVTMMGVVRMHVLFAIDLASRAVEIAGVTRDPDGSWVQQIARNLLDPDEGILRGKRYVILDRDPVFTEAFREMLRGAGVKPLRLPARSPNLNAFAERFVLSVRSECLDLVVPLGEAHLRQVLSEYLVHYHLERNHQGMGNLLLQGKPAPASSHRLVRRRERLGGLLSCYHREAA
jgi:transposase InsO family protein